MNSQPHRLLFRTLATTAFIAAGVIVWFLFTLHGAGSLLAFTGSAGLLGYVWSAWLSKPASQIPVPDSPAAEDAAHVVRAVPVPLTLPSAVGWPDYQPTRAG